jgi:hypothetical protein
MFEIGKSYICIETINNIFSMPLYVKGEVYKVLWLDDEYVILNHILYGCEYAPNTKKYLEGKFKSVDI